MRHKINLAFLFVLFFSFGFFVEGELIDTGGGRYYDTATGEYRNLDGTIKSTTSEGFTAQTTQVSSGNNDKQSSQEQLYNPIYPNCIANSVNINALQCTALINGAYQMISICSGKEISGPCRAERVDGVAASKVAAATSASTGKTCQARFVGFPGVDPNTGLGYYYYTDCGEGETSGGNYNYNTGKTSSYSGTGSNVPSTSIQTNSTTAYINNILNIIRSMIETSKLASQRIASQNTPATTGTLPNAGATSNIPAQTSSVSTARIQQIISQANTLSYGTLTADEQIALTNYLTTNRNALINQNFQTFAPGSVFAWALSMGTNTTLNDQAKSLGFTTFNPVASVFVKTPGYTLAPTSPTLISLDATSFPKTVTVMAETLNVRSSPNLSGTVIRQLKRGDTFVATGLSLGETVYQQVITGGGAIWNGQWFVTEDRNYVWVGGTNAIAANLNTPAI